MTVKTEQAKKWGGTTILPLTGLISPGKIYRIQDVIIDGEKCILIKEDAGPEIIK